MTDALEQIFGHLDQNALFRGGLALSAIGVVALWAKSVGLGLIAWAKRRTVFRVSLAKNEAPTAYYDVVWFIKRMGRLREYDASDGATADDEYSAPVPESPAGSVIIWRGFVPIRVTFVREKNEGANYTREMYRHTVVVSAFCAKLTIEAFLKEANAGRAREMLEQKDQVDVCRMLPDGSISSLCTVRPKELSLVVLPDGVGESLRETVDRWSVSADRYRELGVPHVMGLLLHGSPGTGKTTLAYSLALHLGYNLVLCSPSSVRMGLYMEKCVYLFDDVDRTITDPDAEDGKKRMVGQTVAGMLSALDGTACPGRAVVVMTCNHLDLLDPALVRPGRIDWSHRFEPPTRVMVEFLMSRFFGAPVGLPAFEPGRPMSFYQACCLKHQQDPAAAASEACSADTFGVVRGEPCMN